MCDIFFLIKTSIKAWLPWHLRHFIPMEAKIVSIFNKKITKQMIYLRNRSAPAVNC